MDALLDAYRDSAEMRAAAECLARRDASVGGFWGGSLAFFLAAWEPLLRDAKTSERAGDEAAVAVIVTSSDDAADEILEELEVFAPGRATGLPPWEGLFSDDEGPDPLICADRLAALESLAGDRSRLAFVVAPIQALIQPVVSPTGLESTRIVLRRGEDRCRDDLAETLAAKGYRNVPLVDRPGEFSCRGDVFDVFPHATKTPVRLEFFGDTVDSIRRFTAGSQLSVPNSEVDAWTLPLPGVDEVYRDVFRGEDPLLFDYLGSFDHVIVVEPDDVAHRIERVYHTLGEDDSDVWRAAFSARFETATTGYLTALPPAASSEGNAVAVRFGSIEAFRRQGLDEVFDVLSARIDDGVGTRVYCENDAEAKRFRELLADHRIAEGSIEVATGTVRRGFEVSALSTAVLTTRELFNRRIIRRVRRRAEGRAIQSFLELERGDFVVHIVHGIGRYLGIELLDKDGVEQEYLALQYRHRVKVYVPVSKIDLVQKYIGSGDKVPALDKIGGTAWAKKKEAVESALEDMAAELLEVQSMRNARPGFGYPSDSEWQREFEASFPFEDTPDQAEVTEALKEDMQRSRPMDRLICGDVGYGKTELAMRAAFKIVDAGKQVAVLVPTTLLAEQHYRTFTERMAEFPITVEVLSRFRSKKRQREIVARAAEGAVDILIGTHRLLSNDVGFSDLGMIIIDEEQRFGVQHKERLKRMRSQVEVLTLSATPIPRTLHMAMLGIRDISSLATAPEGRAAIHTEICRFERGKVRDIIVRELNRDGQVYFVHNRVHDIGVIKRELEQAVPEARIEVAHGQMAEGQLEEKMVRFLERDVDVLLATTIIESGIDIPTANTILINEADRYGLADLHQLRGRVGRYKHQAYCYLILPEHRHVQPDAHKRMKSLVEFSGLGSGFQIAMRDLEIRGAGNILGRQQSGHIGAVGYDLYCRLLERCVHKLKDEEYREPVTVEVDLAVEAHIPDEFLAEHSTKLEVYRRASTTKTPEAVDDLRVELEDRFGRLPLELLRLLDLQKMRTRCAAHGIEYVGREDDNLILRGAESMQGFLANCPLRVVVLDGKTVGIPLVERGRSDGDEWTDRRIFELLSSWLETGQFPRQTTGRRRFVDISAP